MPRFFCFAALAFGLLAVPSQMSHQHQASINEAQAALHNGKPTAAAAIFKSLTNALPRLPELWNDYGNACLQACQLENAHAAFSKAIALRPAYFSAHSNRFLCLRYRQSADLLAAAAKDWQAALHPWITAQPFPKTTRPTTQRPLRLGWVSPDFRRHSVSRFLLPVLTHLNRSDFSLILFSDVQAPDAVTAQLKRQADTWVEIAALDDAAALATIRAHQIDILFDLCGHFAFNRQPVFAARAAPIQVSFLGFPGPTFTPNIDFRLSDATIDPAPHPMESTQPLHLPGGAHCFQHPDAAPAIQPLPLLANGFPTFGSANNAFKISPQVARLWGRLLATLPHSRLHIKARHSADPAVQAQISQWITEGGALPAQVSFFERTRNDADHLRFFNDIDLHLDSFPYSGTTTTCEALWMGVPTLTLLGSNPPARVSAAIARQVGLTAFITSSPDAFVHTARTLVQRPAILSTLRSRLRAQIQKTPLGSPAAFAFHFVKALDLLVR